MGYLPIFFIIRRDTTMNNNKNNNYVKIQAAGFVTYCDALIAKIAGTELLACF